MTEPTGLLGMAYGTARGPDDVEAFYTHIRGGRPPSPELLADLRARYEAIGGRSPFIEITEAQVRALQDELNRREGRPAFRGYLGMKHQRPSIEDAVGSMAGDGLIDAVGLVLAPHYSRMSVGEYIERAEKAAAEHGISMAFVEHWHDHPSFVAFVAGRVRGALARLPEGERGRAPIVFSAHSLPVRILEWGDPYPAQLQETADAVAGALGLTNYLTAWQSAGQTGEEWLGPDLTDVVRELAGQGHRAMVCCPVGFVADHLEVLHDIDIEAQAVAREAGVTLVRTDSPNADPGFVRALADVVRDFLREERP